MSLKVAVEWFNNYDVTGESRSPSLLFFVLLVFSRYYCQGIIVKAWAGNYLFFWISTEITNCVNI